MCDVEVDYITFVGPLGSLWELERSWHRIPSVQHVDISGLTVVDMRDAGHAFAYPESLGVAFAYHGSGGAHLAYRIQSDLLVGAADAPRVMCSPGVDYHPAAWTRGGGQQPTVALTPSSWSSLATQLRKQLSGSPYQVGGRKVLVLDTGDAKNAHRMGSVKNNVFTAGPPGDDDGHGTAVCEIIREVRPDADVYVFSAADTNGAITGVTVLAGLIYAYQSDDDFDIVNVSLTANYGSTCATTIGAVLDHVANLSATTAKTHSQPRVVAAAGNAPKKSIAYPALMRGAIVAVATDRQGNAAKYNSVYTTHHGIHPEFAFGGDSGDAFGKIVRTGEPDEEIFGTSFAAPLITAALLP